MIILIFTKRLNSLIFFRRTRTFSRYLGADRKRRNKLKENIRPVDAYPRDFFENSSGLRTKTLYVDNYYKLGDILHLTAYRLVWRIAAQSTEHSV